MTRKKSFDELTQEHEEYNVQFNELIYHYGDNIAKFKELVEEKQRLLDSIEHLPEERKDEALHEMENHDKQLE